MSNNQNPTIGDQLGGLWNGIFGGQVLDSSVSNASRKIRNPVDDDTIEGNISNATNEQVGLGAGILQGVRNFFAGLSEVFGVGAQFFGKFFEGLSNGNFAGTMTGFSADLVNSGRDRPQRLLDRYTENGVTHDVDPSATPTGRTTAAESQNIEASADGVDAEAPAATENLWDNPARTAVTTTGVVAGGLAGGAAGLKVGAGAGAAVGAFFGGFGAVPGAIVGGAVGGTVGVVAGSGIGGAIAYHGTNLAQGAWNGITGLFGGGDEPATEAAPETPEETISADVQTPSPDLEASVSYSPTQDVAVSLIRNTFSGATGPAGTVTEMASVMADAQNMFDMGGTPAGGARIAGLSNDGPFTVAAVHSAKTPEWVTQGGANLNSKLELAV